MDARLAYFLSGFILMSVLSLWFIVFITTHFNNVVIKDYVLEAACQEIYGEDYTWIDDNNVEFQLICDLKEIKPSPPSKDLITKRSGINITGECSD